ncbi:astacin-like metalloprotease toxin 2 [Hydractinia symbiolongicarpus]|uniref:astacin-like metalloprotease toxin 2 n=1 Tax=Hydractinia symbiolongicarpus TaxID=13093 RepID=UPI00254EAB61|nr:astacin-like metalloprotease toxin 2 [Hydractinia symbiolongicarpus]
MKAFGLQLTREEGWCNSYIGRHSYFKNKGQPLSLQGRCFTYSSTIHEILHALGVFHEHVRPDRDKYLKILWENIRPECMLLASVHNFKKRPKQLARTTTMYEYDSLMHYGPYMASKGFHKMTMVPIKDVKRNLRLMSRKNKHFTASDSIKVNTLYQCNLV